VRAGGGHFEYMLCNEYPLNPVYTIQPVVKRLSNGFDNRFDNRLYHVNGAL